MDDELIHDLSAAYALNSLDTHEERFYEKHLAHCLQCQGEVANFSETALALAYAAQPTNPPPELRARILSAAGVGSSRAAGPRRWNLPAAAIAAAAVCATLAGLVVWGEVLRSHSGSDHAQHTLPLIGAKGTVVRSGNGEATIIISGLRAAPTGKTYEAWLMQNGTATPAALFPAKDGTTVVHLNKRIPHGAKVGVTLEASAGTNRLTQRPLFTSARA